MDKQITLSMLTDELAQARTKKKEFLEQMDAIIPWSGWIGIIKPYYYKGERGNKPYELETMLRIHLLQDLYDLSDMSAMTEVIDSRAFSEFCSVDSSNQVPDGDTIGRFRALSGKHGLQEKLFTQVVVLLEAKVLILKKGTIVDSAIISAPSSTKNREKKPIDLFSSLIKALSISYVSSYFLQSDTDSSMAVGIALLYSLAQSSFD